MKKLLILLTTTLLFNGIIWAQCPTGNVYFYTQSDIDNFTANYPGCTQMPGSMIIDTGGSPTNLNGLSQTK